MYSVRMWAGDAIARRAIRIDAAKDGKTKRAIVGPTEVANADDDLRLDERSPERRVVQLAFVEFLFRDEWLEAFEEHVDRLVIEAAADFAAADEVISVVRAK